MTRGGRAVGGSGVIGLLGGTWALRWPWWASLVLAFCWVAVYICRSLVWAWLCAKALEKVAPSRVPDVVAAFTRGFGNDRADHRGRGPGAERGS
jgi:hypothetical protein